jgi:DNA-binding NarL/FixJ family response regulator
MPGTKNVLIVMGNPDEAWAIGRDMIGNDFSVSATTSGRDGFNQLKRNQISFLIVDSSIQEVGVLTFLAYSRKYYPETRTIVICDSNTEITPATAQLAGANFCVPKSGHRDIISDIIIVSNGG